MDGCSAILVLRTRGLVYDSVDFGIAHGVVKIGPFFQTAIRGNCSVINFCSSASETRRRKKRSKRRLYI